MFYTNITCVRGASVLLTLGTHCSFLTTCRVNLMRSVLELSLLLAAISHWNMSHVNSGLPTFNYMYQLEWDFLLFFPLVSVGGRLGGFRDFSQKTEMQISTDLTVDRFTRTVSSVENTPMKIVGGYFCGLHFQLYHIGHWFWKEMMNFTCFLKTLTASQIKFHSSTDLQNLDIPLPKVSG